MADRSVRQLSHTLNPTATQESRFRLDPLVFTPSHRGGNGTPLVLLHGFTGTWHAWDLVLDRLEARHEVFAPTLPAHTGGPPFPEPRSIPALIDGVERILDDAGIAEAHLVGNSLGGFLALGLAARGRARTVTALAPAGGWAEGDPALSQTMAFFQKMQRMILAAAPHADAIAAHPERRANAMQFVTAHPEVMPPDLVVRTILGAAGCRDAVELAGVAAEDDWDLDFADINCPVRIVWGTADRILSLPRAAARYRENLPHADWIELDGIGHCPQLDVPVETAELVLGFTGG